MAKKERVSTAAIYRWRKAAEGKGRLLPENIADPEGWLAEDKFNEVLDTTVFAEAKLAECCRRRGLYRGQIRRWRAACDQANDLADGKARDDAGAVKAERQRSKARERELRRKEAALAETAALRTLREKVAAVWGGRGRMISIPDRTSATELVDVEGVGCRWEGL